MLKHNRGCPGSSLRGRKFNALGDVCLQLGDGVLQRCLLVGRYLAKGQELLHALRPQLHLQRAMPEVTLWVSLYSVPLQHIGDWAMINYPPQLDTK